MFPGVAVLVSKCKVVTSAESDVLGACGTPVVEVSVLGCGGCRPQYLNNICGNDGSEFCFGLRCGARLELMSGDRRSHGSESWKKCKQSMLISGFLCNLWPTSCWHGRCWHHFRVGLIISFWDEGWFTERTS